MIQVTVDGAVATLTLDSPPLNILGAGLRTAVLGAMADFRARRVRAVVVTGAGRAFSAGADLRDEVQLTPDTVRAFLAADESLFAAFAEYPGVTIAAVNGYAYGGGLELALACDIRIAARSARLAGVGATVGLVVSTARLARVVGEAVAKDLLLTARPVGAEEALALGLVSRTVHDGDLLAEARVWADTAATRAPLSVQANKIGLARCARLPLEAAVAYERGEWARLQRTRDHREALAAFFAKRAPVFTGE